MDYVYGETRGITGRPNARETAKSILVYLLLTFFAAAMSFAADNSNTASTIPTFKVIDSQEVDYGTYSIIYNRVETPALKPKPAPIPAIASLPVATPTATELEAAQKEASKNQVVICGDATVYDEGKITILRWWQDGDEYVYRSNINFFYLRSVCIFETEKTSYFLIMAVANGGSLPGKYLNATSVQASGDFQFGLISEPQKAKPETSQFVRDIHAYYAAHKDALISAYQESEKARIAKEQWDKEHPPQHQNYVIQYFPIRSNMSAVTGGNSK